jgi:hypothetical protein
MTPAELKATIQDIENGLAMNPTGEILERLTNRLERAKAKLAELSQKKSEELTGNPGQLTETEKIKRAVLNPSNGIPALNETPEKLKADAEKLVDSGWQKMNAVLSAPVQTTERTIPVLLLGWEHPKEMNRAQIRAEARRYFQAVFTSAKFKKAYGENDLSALWSMKMFCNLWALCQAYTQLTNISFEMIELLQNYWSYTPANQDVANDLAEFLKQPQPE